jgi:TusA-related sulfurtransferase
MTTTLDETGVASLAPEKVVDARGVACPGPLLEAKKSMPSVSVGSVIEIWSTDAQTKKDIEAWSGKVGHEYLGYAAADGYDRVFVRRMK